MIQPVYAESSIPELLATMSLHGHSQSDLITEFDDDMEEDRGLQLSSFLKISPACYEADFWESEEYQQWVHRTYHWSFYSRVIGFPFYLRRYLMQPQITLVVFMEHMTWICWLIVIMWHLQLTRLPRNRRPYAAAVWLHAERAFWTVFMAGLLTYIRFSAATQPAIVAASGFLYVPEAPPSTLSSTRNLLFVSGASSSLVMGLTLLIPFHPQIFFSSCYILMLLAWHLQPAVHMLNHAGPTSGILAICQSVNRGQYLTEAVLFGLPLEFHYRTAACKQHHTTVLVIAAMFTCSLIPAYISYCLERHAKLQYMYRLAQAPLKAPVVVWVDGLLLVCSFTAIWMVAICYHHLFMRYSVAATVFQGTA